MLRDDIVALPIALAVGVVGNVNRADERDLMRGRRERKQSHITNLQLGVVSL